MASQDVQAANVVAEAAADQELAQPAQPKPVICRIILRDDSTIEISDKKATDEILVIKRMLEQMDDEATVNEISLVNYEPEHVRFVIENAAGFAEKLDNFERSEYYNICDDFEHDKVVDIMIVADFLECHSVLNGLATIMADILADLNGSELMELFELDFNTTEEEKEQVRKQVSWCNPQ